MAWDRFAAWPRGRARIALVLFALLAMLAAWAPGMPKGPLEAPDLPQSVSAGTGPAGKATAADSADPADPAADGKDNDLRFYRLVIERVKRGDDYYSSATSLQRSNNYPVAPGFTVRLPTLAVVSAYLGKVGVAVAFFGLLAAVLAAWWRRLGSEPGGLTYRPVALGLLFVGLSTAIKLDFAVLHEVWAAEFMALSLALYRPEKGHWLGALLAAAAALAVRELALPFVLLLATWALWHRRWREAAAWGALIALFGAAMLVHLGLAEAQIRPGDPVSPPWLVLGGMQGFLYKIIYSSSLNLLPVVVAGPLVIFALLGWSGWKGTLGTLTALLLLGYAAAFMIAGRDNNFYWGVLICPLLFVGLAPAPFALKSLWRAAMSRQHSRDAIDA